MDKVSKHEVEGIEEVKHLFDKGDAQFYTAEVRFKDNGKKYRGTFVVIEDEAHIFLEWSEFGLIERSAYFENMMNPNCVGQTSLSPIEGTYPVIGFFWPETGEEIDEVLINQ